MANRLDIVTIGIQQECGIVVWVILGAKPRRTIVNAVCGYASGEKCIDSGARSRTKSDVDARYHQRVFGQPELTAGIGAPAMSVANAKADRLGTILKQDITKFS